MKCRKFRRISLILGLMIVIFMMPCISVRAENNKGDGSTVKELEKLKNGRFTDGVLVYKQRYYYKDYVVMGVYDENATVILIPETLVYDGIENPVTMIQAKAFYENKKITSVTIPDSITVLGKYAFACCSNLETVNISDNSGLKDIYQKAHPRA